MKQNNLSFLNNRRISITFRLTALYAIILSLLILFLSFINFKVVQYLVVETNKAELTRSSENIASYLIAGGAIEPLLEKSNLNPNLHIRIIDNGEIIYENRPAPLEDQYNTNLDTHRLVGKGVNYVLLNKKVEIGNREIFVQLGLDMKTTSDFLGVMYQSLLGINIVGILISILSGIYLTKRILRPIEAISRTARNISINDLSQRIDTSGPSDELKELAKTINSMVDRLERSVEKQKQFISDASHELRTPIAVIQGYTRMLERWGKKDPAILDESIEAISIEAENMRRIFEQLLTLAQADSGHTLPEYELFSLRPLIEDTVRDFKLIAPGHRIDIISTSDNELYADRTAIQQLLRILLDNCVKYTPEEGSITINVEQKDAQTIIEVSDTGVGISAEDLPRIFDRFYRSEKSRSKKMGGTGLGLSIAKWITEIHGGTIDVSSVFGVGTTVRITLPTRRNKLVFLDD